MFLLQASSRQMTEVAMPIAGQVICSQMSNALAQRSIKFMSTDLDTAHNVPEYTVEQISLKVRRTVEDSFGQIRVRGEVSSVSRPASGHVYLSFKEGRHQLDAVIWRSTAHRIGEVPSRGIEYTAIGRLTAYSGNSKYQMVIERIEPAGAGALLMMLEERRERLRKEGLFEPEHKKSIPHIPDVIGVVTSPSGAVIRDIVHRVRHRFPRRILVWPAAVQGQNCVEEVVAAIRGFNAIGAGEPVPRPDLLIIARGGGSLEDLLGFSEEDVVRAVFDSDIPIISAIGHETDTTLVDFVADLRAPTPTAAAELAVPVRTELSAKVTSLETRLRRAVDLSCRNKHEQVMNLSRLLPSQESLLAPSRQHIDRLADRMSAKMSVGLQGRRVRFTEVASQLSAPKTLERIAARLQFATVALRAGMGAVLRHSHGRYAVVDSRDMQKLLAASIAHRRSHLERTVQRLAMAVTESQASRNRRIDGLARLLDSLSYRQTLSRGFAVVHGDGKVAKSRTEAVQAKKLEVEFFDSRLKVEAASN